MLKSVLLWAVVAICLGMVTLAAMILLENVPADVQEVDWGRAAFLTLAGLAVAILIAEATALCFVAYEYFFGQVNLQHGKEFAMSAYRGGIDWIGHVIAVVMALLGLNKPLSGGGVGKG